ncbi:Uncharacterized protein pbN1_00230 [Aromatoleum bremense]|nr:Uncharacterized protein pbN1_00230 [Aromatoleum bremense]
MKTRIPKRVYTEQFRDAAVRQVIEPTTPSGLRCTSTRASSLS